MIPLREVIYLIADEPSVQEALVELLEALEFEVIAFESATSFLSYPRQNTCSCMILDVQLPDLNGLDLQKRRGTWT